MDTVRTTTGGESRIIIDDTAHGRSFQDGQNRFDLPTTIRFLQRTLVTVLQHIDAMLHRQFS
jgi:hypothetical protein